MSDNFIGLTILVTLTSSRGQFKGIVSGIEPGMSLTLRDAVTCLPSRKYFSEITILATDIQEVVDAAPDSPDLMRAYQTMAIKDPAILSLEKRPTPLDISLKESPISRDEKKVADTTTSHRSHGATLDVSMVKTLVESTTNEDHKEDKVRVTEHLQGKQETSHLEKTEPLSTKRQEKRGNKASRSRGRKGQKLEEDTDQDVTADPLKPVAGCKGWRKTPLLEPHPSFQPFSILKRKGQCREEEGWATEDATDLQELGDFDFEGGLAKFDKNTVFNQIQAEDSTVEEDRLVSHNRLPKNKSGTAGSKNLHFSENILNQPKPTSSTPKTGAVTQNSYQTDFSDDLESSQQESTSGNHVRLIEIKSSINQQPLDLRPASESSSTNVSSLPSVRFSISQAPSDPAFFTVSSGRRCESVSPLQMLNLESIADNELGLSEDMMAENSGRGIAEVAFYALKTDRHRSTNKHAQKLTVVIFAGNNKSGLRAISAARHLQNHGISTVACVLGLEREPELLVGLKRQIQIFRNFGGKILNRVGLFEFLRQNNVQVDLIIDGIVGLSVSLEELRLSDQTSAYELISWANKRKVSVLAIDVPTGVDPTHGNISVIDGRELYLHANYVVAMGAPMKGLLEAMSLGHCFSGDEDQQKTKEWQPFVADIGLGAEVWKKAGTKVRKGIEFGGSWILQMHFQKVTN